MSFSYLNMQNYQQRLDLNLPKLAGTVIRADSAYIMELCDYNEATVKKELRMWISRHDDYCSVLDEDPLTVKIYESIREGGR